MQRLKESCVVLLCLFLGACTSAKVDYMFDALRRHATQDEVRQRLGAPFKINSYPEDKVEFWLYHWFGVPTETLGNIFCTEYSLLFHEDKVVRQVSIANCDEIK